MLYIYYEGVTCACVTGLMILSVGLAPALLLPMTCSTAISSEWSEDCVFVTEIVTAIWAVVIFPGSICYVTQYDDVL
jgi:hypothetical protein